MSGNKSLVTKLSLVITLCGSLIFAATLGYNYYYSRAILEEELETNARNLVMSLVHRVEAELLAVAKVAEGLANTLETVHSTNEDMLALLRRTVENNQEVYGSVVAFEPQTVDTESEMYAPYYYRDKGKIILSQLEKTYKYVPYLYWDWYQIPKELGKPEWSEPYFDEGGGNIPLATYSVPFYERSGATAKLKGVVAADISLESLTKLISSVKVYKTGYAALLSRNGLILAHPLQDAVMNESFFSIAEERDDPFLRQLGKKMISGESDFILYTSLVGARSWLYYAPIRSTGWTLAVVFPEAELLENVSRLSLTMAAMGLVGILLLTAAVASIAISITKPLRSLAEATQVMSQGNFDVSLPEVRTNDEVGRLTQAFRLMTKALQEYIVNLTETTAAKERIQSELNVATEIQASLLPRLFPAFPDRPEFDIYASMDPAKEVGGDFYDFFFIDKNNLCFLIADVAGKGVPAALYMMVAKTLLKAEGQRLGEPDKILSYVNAVLSSDNDSCMFATVFCAILNSATGEVRFANAGHNPPLLLDKRGVQYLSVLNGFVLGPMEDFVYETEKLTMEEGDILFLYTDGVTEATNSADELYGESRLLMRLQNGPQTDLPAMIQNIRADVKLHANGAPQSDDVTMVAVKYRGTDSGGQSAPNTN